MKIGFLALRAISVSIIALAVLLPLTGCGHFGGNKVEDTVSGFYAGDWYGPNPERSLGTLTCTATPSGPDSWNALFAATFGDYGEYEVPLEGKREENKVVFGGSVDLGEADGGVFDWSGEIVGDDFTGTYTSRFINGSFRMKRSEPPSEP